MLLNVKYVARRVCKSPPRQCTILLCQMSWKNICGSSRLSGSTYLNVTGSSLGQAPYTTAHKVLKEISSVFFV